MLKIPEDSPADLPKGMEIVQQGHFHIQSVRYNPQTGLFRIITEQKYPRLVSTTYDDTGHMTLDIGCDCGWVGSGDGDKQLHTQDHYFRDGEHGWYETMVRLPLPPAPNPDAELYTLHHNGRYEVAVTVIQVWEPVG